MADFETQNEVRQRQADAEAKALKAAQKAAGIHATKSNKPDAVAKRAADEAAIPAEAPGSKQSGADAAGTAGGAFKETGAGGNQMNVGAGTDSASTQRSAPSDRAHSSDTVKNR